MVHPHFSIRFPLYYLKKIYLKMSNVIFRPRVSISMNQQTVIFTNHDDQKRRYKYFCLIIENNKSKNLHLNLKKLQINDYHYTSIIQFEDNYLKLRNRLWKNCGNEIYNVYFQNRFDIDQNNFIFLLKPYSRIIFPMRLIKGDCHIITTNKKSTFLFKEKKDMYCS